MQCGRLKTVNLFLRRKTGIRSLDISGYMPVDKDIYVDCINGYTDHVHCLISPGASQSISKVMQLLKGESAYWANQHKLFTQKLEWQDEYFAASISHSMLTQVRNYIYNQEKHHAARSFAEEYNELISRYEATP
jgi:hypothetical protein